MDKQKQDSISNRTKSKTKRMVLDALLSAVALIIFVVELQFPPLTPIPGIKTGLSNIITLVAMFLLTPIDALSILLVRIFLGCIFSGQVMALAYSLAGGLFSFLVLFILKKAVSEKQLFACGVFCAIAHNLGQITVAVLITKTTTIFFYLPVLCVSGIVTGIFTGLCAQFALKYLKKIFPVTQS